MKLPSFKFLLIAGSLISGLLPCLLVAALTFQAAQRGLLEQAFRQLESVRDLKRSELERDFQDTARHLEHLASRIQPLAEPERAILLSNLAGSQHAEAWLLRADSPQLQLAAASPPSHPIALREAWRFAVWREETALSELYLQTNPPRRVQYLATPVFAQERLVGVLVVTFDHKAVDALMGERSGMGATGETYLVGPDRRMRSDSFLAPVSHTVEASHQGTVEQNGVDTEAARAALTGRAGHGQLLDYRQVPVLSAYTPVRLGGLTWALVAEIDEAEIDQLISHTLIPQLLSLVGLLTVLVTALAVLISLALARGISRVTRALADLIERVLAGELTARIPPASAGPDFEVVANQINLFVDRFVAQVEERRKLEEVIHDNQRMESVGTLAGGIAHDFNNILTYMYTCGDLIDGALPPGSAAQRQLQALMGGLDRASELVSQLMLFGRQMTREKRPVNFPLIVKEAVRLIKVAAHPGIKVERQIGADALWLMADPTQLHRVVVNLCANAVQAMQTSGGVLTVSLTSAQLGDGQVGELSAGPYVCLTVTDTGPGIPPEIQHRIFEPFFTTKAPGQGTGMGLSVVFGIVQSYQGAITVASQPGEGAIFKVYLPQSASPNLDIESTRLAPIHGTARLLLVDDEVAILSTTSTLLTSLGFEVTTAQSVAEALSHLEQQPVDLVLTDLRMPGRDGMSLVEAAKRRWPTLPVAVLTGYSEGLTAEEAMARGAAGLLSKPYRAGELTHLIAALLKRSRASDAPAAQSASR